MAAMCGPPGPPPPPSRFHKKDLWGPYPVDDEADDDDDDDVDRFVLPSIFSMFQVLQHHMLICSSV